MRESGLSLQYTCFGVVLLQWEGNLTSLKGIAFMFLWGWKRGIYPFLKSGIIFVQQKLQAMVGLRRVPKWHLREELACWHHQTTSENFKKLESKTTTKPTDCSCWFSSKPQEYRTVCVAIVGIMGSCESGFRCYCTAWGLTRPNSCCVLLCLGFVCFSSCLYSLSFSSIQYRYS